MDIFDPEIIYNVTSLTFEPFIDCDIDTEQYKKGTDYIISYTKSTKKCYLCIVFNEELSIIDPDNSVIKRKSYLGTVIVIDNRGTTIRLKNPLSDISNIWIGYIDCVSQIPKLEHSTLIDPFDTTNITKNQIYISNNETFTIVNGEHIVKRSLVGKWSSDTELYPKHILVEGPNPVKEECCWPMFQSIIEWFRKPSRTIDHKQDFIDSLP